MGGAGAKIGASDGAEDLPGLPGAAPMAGGAAAPSANAGHATSSSIPARSRPPAMVHTSSSSSTPPTSPPHLPFPARSRRPCTVLS
ncbi:hypothetical protein PR202_gb28635 [Eleusine coracana subsp. coracana]|uniref:Uncharacterized protein n=1 Tax=Eleusine coracana subsp. coracana TaxID=191504 RepID=A0AAV5FWW2_ELECO|nr:hypothetical protein PR202_gb28635 [Eleusine coracana subsp. coracana]